MKQGILTNAADDDMSPLEGLVQAVINMLKGDMLSWFEIFLNLKFF